MVDLSGRHLLWEVDWILEKMSRYAELSDFPEIMEAALARAAENTASAAELVLRLDTSELYATAADSRPLRLVHARSRAAVAL